MLDLVKQRRSIRKFTAEPVSEADWQSLLTVALLGPTSMGKKPLEFVVVQEAATIARLKTCKAKGADAVGAAPLVIAVLADGERTDVWAEDASIAAITMQLEAERLGLGSTWVQMRLRKSVDGLDSEEAVRQVLGIPARYGVLCLLAVGHKGEHKPPYTVADADFSKVHRERFTA